MDWSSFLHGLSGTLGSIAAYAALAVFSAVAFKFFAKHKQDAAFATIALGVIKSVLAEKLGPKATAVFDLWLEGLKSVQDNSLTDEQMADDFVKYLNTSLQGKTDLTDEENSAIKTAAVACFSMLRAGTAPATKAISLSLKK